MILLDEEIMGVVEPPSYVDYLHKLGASGLGDTYNGNLITINICRADKIRELGLVDVVSVTLEYSGGMSE